MKHTGTLVAKQDWITKSGGPSQNLSCYSEEGMGAELGIGQAKLECFEPFHQHSLKERGKGHAMAIKHITSGELREYDYTRFQVHDKVDFRYERYYLGGVPIKTPPFPLISQHFFLLCVSICRYDEAGVGWF